jgi:hypothetical protein
MKLPRRLDDELPPMRARGIGDERVTLPDLYTSTPPTDPRILHEAARRKLGASLLTQVPPPRRTRFI